MRIKAKFSIFAVKEAQYLQASSKDFPRNPPTGSKSRRLLRHLRGIGVCSREGERGGGATIKTASVAFFIRRLHIRPPMRFPACLMIRVY